MADPAVFERTCEEIVQATGLDELAARGTVRLALKAAGLDARSVSGAQMAVVLTKLMPAELSARGVADAAQPCAEIARRVARRRRSGGQLGRGRVPAARRSLAPWSSSPGPASCSSSPRAG